MTLEKRFFIKASIAISLVAFAALYAVSGHAATTEPEHRPIRIVGSSTVYPFSASAAEQFGEGGQFATPIVEQTGTGGGIQFFCDGSGYQYPDIVNASRPMKPEEREYCAENGVKNITEISLGYDGIVLANSKEAKPLTLAVNELFLALAKDVPQDGKLVPNFYQNWSDIDKRLPDRKIEIYGPPHTSGTRDAFEEIVMEKACKAFPIFAEQNTDKEKLKKACRAVREDGFFVEQGENDNVIIQKLKNNPDAFGIFGYAFMEQNLDKVQGVLMDGIEPTFSNIADGSYPVARSLFVYVKDNHVEAVPGMVAYLQELTSEEAIGEDGYLTLEGLIPLPEVLQEEQREKVQKLIR